MIIEDDVDISNLLVAIFSDDFRVRALYSAVTALAVLKEDPADLVLCDACLPTMNGYDFASQLRNDPQTSSIPVVIMSGLDDGFSADHAFDAGAVGFLPKPFAINELHEVALRHLGAASSQDSVRPPLTADTV